MSGVNKVILVGHLGKTPELHTTQNGKTKCSMSLATSESWQDKDGNKQERTEWHNLVAWDRTAEVCVKYLEKGRQVYVEGRLATREYEAKDGTKRRVTEVIVSDVQFLGSGKDASRPTDRDVPREAEPHRGDDAEIPF